MQTSGSCAICNYPKLSSFIRAISLRSQPGGGCGAKLSVIMGRSRSRQRSRSRSRSRSSSSSYSSEDSLEREEREERERERREQKQYEREQRRILKQKERLAKAASDKSNECSWEFFVPDSDVDPEELVKIKLSAKKSSWTAHPRLPACAIG